jgi:diphthine-ammonia ligase
MKSAVLFSGGKDSVYAAYLAKKKRYKLTCLISIFSENPDSYMFHTPSIEKTKHQAKVMNLPLIIQKTKGEKEKELEDLEKAIKKAKKIYKINNIISGALASNYQKFRIENICKKLDLKSITPLWKRNELEYLRELIKNKFKVILTGVFAYPFDKSWLGRKIDNRFIDEIKELKSKYKVNPVGEGGEFETFVLNCPLFKKSLKIKNYKFFKEGENSWRMEIETE